MYNLRDRSLFLTNEGEGGGGEGEGGGGEGEGGL